MYFRDGYSANIFSRVLFSSLTGFADPEHVERATSAAVERGDAGFDFDDGVADGFEAEAAVGLGEKFAFDDAGVVADGLTRSAALRSLNRRAWAGASGIFSPRRGLGSMIGTWPRL